MPKASRDTLQGCTLQGLQGLFRIFVFCFAALSALSHTAGFRGSALGFPNRGVGP